MSSERAGRFRAFRWALLVLLVSTSARSAELSPVHRLRRLSVHLRGFAPSPVEYLALEEASRRGETEAFFTKQTDAYLASPEYVGKMVERADALFRFRSPRVPTERWSPESEAFPVGSGFDFLVADVVRGNESWDRLLGTPGYRLYSYGPLAAANPDVLFLRLLAPELLANEKGYFRYTVAPGDGRFAGAVTTARFFARYSTTNLNRNRGRAAALFRIFLCDDMKAVVQGGANEEQELLNTAFPPPPSPDAYHRLPKAFAKADAHGTDASCRACHYKLDPLGRAFVSSGEVLGEEAAPGALTYRRADGTLVDVPGRGLADVARAIAAEPEYAACQVTHFWKWFIRADRLPTEARRRELVAAFESRGRRVNDFVRYLVSQPEFFHDDTVSTPSLRDVKDALVRCDGCHSGLEDAPPPFVAFPIGGDRESHRRWLERIAARLDLAHDGKARSMPPAASAWQPSSSELYRLKAWIADGANDEGDHESVEPAWGQALVAAAGPLTVRATTEFHGTFRRYLSGLDVLRQWTSRFPNATWPVGHPCGGQDDRNRALLGDANPATGEPVYRAPSAAYVRWYTRCAEEAVGKELDASLGKDPGRFYGKRALALLADAGQAALVADPNKTLWRELPVAVRDAVVDHLLREFVGPSVIEDESAYRRKLLALADRKWSDRTLQGALRNLLLAVASQDAFLTF